MRVARKSLIAAIVVLLAISMVVTVQASEAVLPIALGDTVEGSLSEDIPRQPYNFSISSPTDVTITLTSDEFDAYLLLLDQAGQVVDEDDDGAGRLNAQIDASLAAGEYIIVATSLREYRTQGEFFATGAYTLSLTGEGGTGPDVPPPPPPPGDNAITYGQTVTGELTLEAPFQDWTFSGSAGDEVTISVVSQEFDTFLILFDDQEFEVAFDDDSGDGLNSTIGPFLLPLDGTYTIRVSSYDWEFLGIEAPGVYDLTLQSDGVVITPPPPPPGDNVIAIGETQTGTLSTQQPFADWTFTASEGDTVTIAVRSLDFDTYLLLFDDQEMELARDDDGGDGLNSRIGPFPIPADGTYTIRVTSYDWEVLGAEVGGNYELTVESAEIVPIVLGESVTGTIDSANLLDVYGFEGTAGQIITAELMTTGFATYMELIGPGGLRTFSNEGIIGPVVLPEDGTYTIVVTSFDTFEPEDYTLTVNAVEPVRVTYGEEIAANFDDSSILYYTFDGKTGDTVDVIVNSEGTVDTRLVLLGPNGDVLAADDDGGAGFDPEIRGFVLTENGTYSVSVRPYINGDNGDFTLTINEATPSLDEGPQVVRLSDKRSSGSVTFEGVAGETVTLQVRGLAAMPGEPRVVVTQEGETLAANSVGMVLRLSLEFVVPEDGRVNVTVMNSDGSPAILEFALVRSGGNGGSAGE